MINRWRALKALSGTCPHTHTHAPHEVGAQVSLAGNVTAINKFTDRTSLQMRALCDDEGIAHLFIRDDDWCCNESVAECNQCSAVRDFNEMQSLSLTLGLSFRGARAYAYKTMTINDDMMRLGRGLQQWQSSLAIVFQFNSCPHTSSTHALI